MPERRFEIGDKVMARWPKSQLYYIGEILDFNDVEYLIKFEDEQQSEMPVKYKDVTRPFTRSRSRSIGRSPIKRASSKSPSRRSPSRKSPGRPPATTKISGSKSPGRPITKIDTSLSPNEFKSSRKEIKEETAKLINDSSPQEIQKRSQTTTNLRQSARIASIEKQTSYSETKMNSSSTVIGSNSIKVDAKSIAKSLQDKSRFVTLLQRSLWALFESSKALTLAFIISAIPFIFTILCTSKKCDIQVPDIPRKLSQYYDQKAVFITSGFILSTLVLALVPIGRAVRTKTGARVRRNGFLSLLTSAVAVGVLLYLKINISSLYLLMRPMFFTLAAFGTVLALLLYVKSFYARRDSLNPDGKSGYYIADFIYGREISPRIGSFDIKFFLFRLSAMLCLFLCLLPLGKHLQMNPGKYSVTLLLAVGMKVFYIMDLILFEDSYLSTFEYANMGTGFIFCIFYLTMPFLYTLDVRYVLNYPQALSWYCLVAIGILFLVGYAVLRGANSQKHAFRTNPSDPALAHLESLPTSAGKRLLVSGYWGYVRHPNYVGDILAQLAIVFLCGFQHSIPWLTFLISMLFFVGRVFQVEKACKDKYGLAWSNYTSRVPARLIPKVF